MFKSELRSKPQLGVNQVNVEIISTKTRDKSWDKLLSEFSKRFLSHAHEFEKHKQWAEELNASGWVNVSTSQVHA